MEVTCFSTAETMVLLSEKCRRNPSSTGPIHVEVMIEVLQIPRVDSFAFWLTSFNVNGCRFFFISLHMEKFIDTSNFSVTTDVILLYPRFATIWY